MRSGRLGGWLAAGAFVVVTGSLAWAFWPSNPATTAPQARHYLNVSACLLTDSRGIVPGAPGAPAWAAMQKASLATRVMFSYLPDTGTADAPVMLNTLVQRHCGVIITTGTAARQVLGVAKANPRQRFLLIANRRPAGLVTTSNVVIVTAVNAAGRIDQVIHGLAPAA